MIIGGNIDNAEFSINENASLTFENFHCVLLFYAAQIIAVIDENDKKIFPALLDEEKGFAQHNRRRAFFVQSNQQMPAAVFRRSHFVAERNVEVKRRAVSYGRQVDSFFVLPDIDFKARA